MDELLKDLFKAYFTARKNKRNTINALRFEINFEHNLIELNDEIVSGNYQPRPGICFIVNKPVKREIFAADFRYRIVHHLIFNYISPVFEKHFINDSYSCRKGKGTSYGIKRVSHFIRTCSENYQKDCYILKMDIQGYFMSIDKKILFNLVSDTLDNHSETASFALPLVKELIKKNIFNDPTKNYILKGKRADWIGLPSTKSLFYSEENRGLPIGNLTSQLFSNIYLNPFDHFIKRDLGIKCYGRYVDDFIIVHNNKEYLKSLIPVISDFLKHRLLLTLHPKKIYLQHHQKGVQFLGTIIKPYRIYISGHVIGNFSNAIDQQNLLARKHRPTDNDQRAFVCTVNSYLGIMKHYKTFRMRRKIMERSLSCYWWNYISVKSGFSLVKLKRLRARTINA